MSLDPEVSKRLDSIRSSVAGVWAMALFSPLFLVLIVWRLDVIHRDLVTLNNVKPEVCEIQRNHIDGNANPELPVRQPMRDERAKDSAQRSASHDRPVSMPSTNALVLPVAPLPISPYRHRKPL